MKPWEAISETRIIFKSKLFVAGRIDEVILPSTPRLVSGRPPELIVKFLYMRREGSVSFKVPEVNEEELLTVLVFV